MKQVKELPPQARLNELFNYNRDTGLVIRRITAGSRSKAGSVAGTATTEGYIGIGIDGKKYLLHRIIWKIVYGECPTNLSLDHENGVRNDNRISNLRIGNSVENAHNMKDVKGYFFFKSRGKWIASIRNNYKRKHLGCFNTEAEASAAYQYAKAERDSHDYKRI